jgi:peptidoglycan/xylan/chitin deacetylase (PgdA/CDA1 family)
MKSLPFVSVVIPVYNEETLLAGCLASLKRQDYQGVYEVIVVNNACTDRSPDMARANGIRVVGQPTKGYVGALRTGFAAARGRVIACTDADTRVPPSWLSGLVQCLLYDPHVVAVGGIFRLFDCNPFLTWLGNLAGYFNWHLAGGNMAIWKWAYHRVGGFDPKINMGTDVELGLRLKRLGRVSINRRLVVETSGRRFQFAFWHTLWVYFLNDLCLVIFHHPAVHDFSDIRRRYDMDYWHSMRRLIAVFLSAVIFLGLQAETPKSQIFGPVLSEEKTTKKIAALTFDDGPSAYTNAVLDILDWYGVKATFFVVGENVRLYPQTVRRMVAEGDVIGNHTFDHSLLTAIDPPRQIKREIDETTLAVEEIAGVQPSLFRPPHGWRNPWMMSVARREHFTVVTWSDSPDDWRQLDPQAIVQRVLKNVHPGVIILLHDGLETQAAPRIHPMLAALPGIIEALQAQGYRLVTIQELIEISDSGTAHGSNEPTPRRRGAGCEPAGV